MPNWLPWVLLFLGVSLVGLAVWYVRHRAARRKVYEELAADRARVVEKYPPRLSPEVPEPPHDAFVAEPIVRVPHFLDEESFRVIREECLANLGKAERSFLPKHKKGGTLSYESIQRHAPAALAFYHAPAIREYLSRVVGASLEPTADHDQSSCSVLYYTEGGDHINWHFDHNFYRGRHFTVLLSVCNRGKEGGLSAGKLQQKRQDGTVLDYDTSENVLVIFEGAKVLHRASPTADGDQRIMLSMTFGTDPRIGPVREAARRVKDTAYYGLRALWD